MKVFLSWSGDVSHKVACALRDWLPLVIQPIKPYVSSEDIDKGTRWSTDIAQELEESTYGILCITKENLAAPWINFEAGALSKTVDKSHVSPFLFRLKRSDVQGPLLQFQSTVYEKEDVYKLLASINNCLEANEKLEEQHLSRTFEVWWPKLAEELDVVKVHKEENTDHKKESPREESKRESMILEELLDLARNQLRLLSSPESILPPDYVGFAMQRYINGNARNEEIIPDLERLHTMIIDLDRISGALSTDNVIHQDIKEQISRIHHVVHNMLPSRSRRPRFKSASRPAPAE